MAVVDLSNRLIRPGWKTTIASAGRDMPEDLKSFTFPDPSDWSPLLEAMITDRIASNDVDLLKESTGGSVWRVRAPLPTGLRSVICRSWRARGALVARASTVLKSGPAHRHWRKSMRLIRAGVPTSLPLVLCEPVRGRGAPWLVTADVEDALDLDTIVLTELPRLNRSELAGAKRRLIEPVAELLARLHRSRVYHRDLKASNVLFTDWKSLPRPWIVDVEGVRPLGAKRDWFPLVRLASSLLSYPCVTRADFLRVFRSYERKVGKADSGWQIRFRDLGGRVLRHSTSTGRRKGSKLDGFAGNW